MFFLLYWALFGLVVGVIAKAIYPAGDGAAGCGTTVVIGIVGSFIGGGIHWLLGGGHYHHSGFLLSILGGVILCAAWRAWAKKIQN